MATNPEIVYSDAIAELEDRKRWAKVPPEEIHTRVSLLRILTPAESAAASVPHAPATAPPALPLPLVYRPPTDEPTLPMVPTDDEDEGPAARPDDAHSQARPLQLRLGATAVPRDIVSSVVPESFPAMTKERLRLQFERVDTPRAGRSGRNSRIELLSREVMMLRNELMFEVRLVLSRPLVCSLTLDLTSSLRSQVYLKNNFVIHNKKLHKDPVFRAAE